MGEMVGRSERLGQAERWQVGQDEKQAVTFRGGKVELGKGKRSKGGQLRRGKDQRYGRSQDR